MLIWNSCIKFKIQNLHAWHDFNLQHIFLQFIKLISHRLKIFVTGSLVLYVCFEDRYLSFCTFSFGHCVVCSSLIYRFWLTLWYLRYTDSDCPFGILDIQILIAPLVSSNFSPLSKQVFYLKVHYSWNTAKVGVKHQSINHLNIKL